MTESDRDDMIAEIVRLQVDNKRLNERHREIVGELFGKGFEVLGWHLNGDTELLDT